MKANIDKGKKDITPAELRELWNAWVKARVKEGLSKEQAEITAELMALAKIFNVEPEDFGIARCGCGCGKIFGPTMKTIRILTTIAMVLIGEHLPGPPVDGNPDGQSVQELEFEELAKLRPIPEGSIN